MTVQRTKLIVITSNRIEKIRKVVPNRTIGTKEVFPLGKRGKLCGQLGLSAYLKRRICQVSKPPLAGTEQIERSDNQTDPLRPRICLIRKL